MDQKDMMRLIETEDEINQMDKVFEQLAGYGHASGDFIKLDNVYDVIQHNAHPAYSGSEEADLKFIEILYDRKRTPDERAEILLRGKV
ncbi:hypothetical protein D7V86_19570 [bacterium D16-51]|nr:hypothetical protein D7V96_19790 [bacterium D16-59]RKI56568.1 hypothetical protein D7V86_19570 [bacterium D16-51]